VNDAQIVSVNTAACAVVKVVCEAGVGAHLTKPGWSKPHTRSNLLIWRYFDQSINQFNSNLPAREPDSK